MATEQLDADVKTTKPKYKCEYEILTNENPKVTEGFREIGIMLDAELGAEEARVRRSEAGRA